MACCSSENYGNPDDSKKSKEIDRSLRTEQKEMTRRFKFLLLGNMN